jgi:hypothetical protein
MNIQEVNLTEDDFNLIIKSLDFLPSKDLLNVMIRSTIIMALSNSEEETKRRLEEVMKSSKNDEAERGILKEDISILKGKLILLKRFLVENSAITEVNNILKKETL